jgi:CRP/FNR family transcriptional regulator, cyclic AMP receptor protein
VLALDQDLGGTLGKDAYPSARERCTARLVGVPAGSRWSALDPLDASRHLGLLVVRGVLLHRLHLAGRETVDLVGPGDLIRPWPPVDEFAELFTASRWQVLEPAQLAALDLQFLCAASAWPELLVALTERTAWHARSLELRLAISQMPNLKSRLRVMLWHLADRFGRVDRYGVFVPLPLSREVLAELVGARRESVSRRLTELADSGAVVRDRKGWRLYGAPPVELSAIDSAAGESSSDADTLRET